MRRDEDSVLEEEPKDRASLCDLCGGETFNNQAICTDCTSDNAEGSGDSGEDVKWEEETDDE
jgi:hypothetical protein